MYNNIFIFNKKHSRPIGILFPTTVRHCGNHPISRMTDVSSAESEETCQTDRCLQLHFTTLHYTTRSYTRLQFIFSEQRNQQINIYIQALATTVSVHVFDHYAFLHNHISHFFIEYTEMRSVQPIVHGLKGESLT